MIVEIEAKFSCDDCGTEFIVTIDPAYVPPKEWSVFSIAEDAVRLGTTYRDGRDGDRSLADSGSVDGDGRHYCAKCTRKRDDQWSP
mgnify:FL=1